MSNPIMGSAQSIASLVMYLFLFCSVLSAQSISKEFLQCLTENSHTSISSVVYSPSNSSYEPVFEFADRNLRLETPTRRKPSFIITPLHESHIQAAVICSRRQGFLLRVRSGGHDFEGQSSSAPKPFVMLDFVNFRSIHVDIKSSSAWVQAGATVGEVNYRIAEKSNTHGFPAARYPTVGIGGMVAGGGVGFLARKYGLSADNVLDIKFVDAKGKLHDRKSMGEDLFWALRGGGGNSFGVILAWKLKLVRVTSIVTVSRVQRTLEQDGASIFDKYQNIAHKLPKELFLDCLVLPVQGENTRTVGFTFESAFQGRTKQLVQLMEKNFPELGLTAKDCIEMSWVNSTVFQVPSDGPVEILLNRSLQPRGYFKGGYDYVEKAIPMAGLEGLFKELLVDESIPQLGFEPMGGRMSEIPETATPYPHRKGILFGIRYIQFWVDDSASTSNMETAQRIFDYMTPYVSKSPRRAYINCKDLNFGVNRNAKTSYSEARVWAEHYFKDNFARLARVKSKVDPGNYFWDQQSIPPFVTPRLL